jgi:hypothetical protein
MKKIDEGSVTLLFNDDGLDIEIRDEGSSVIIVKATLNVKQACQALSRLGNTPAKVEVGELSRVGLYMIHDILKFEVDRSVYYSHHDDNNKGLNLLADKACPEGWRPDYYFNSQNSFFTEGQKSFARCIIRKWVTKEEADRFNKEKEERVTKKGGKNGLDAVWEDSFLNGDLCAHQDHGQMPA